jgi:hypothetical protein
MTRILRTLAARLRDERGMALVMALGISMVLAIAGASLVLYSITNEHHATRSRSDLRGYNIAQTGIENAVAQIAAATDTDGDGAVDYDDPTIFSALPPSSKTEAFGTGEQVVWDAQLWDDRPNPSVLYAPSGNPYYIPNLRWHVVSTSTVPNPAAAQGTTITRRLESDVRLVPAKEQPVNSDAWRYIYSKKELGDPPWSGDPSDPLSGGSYDPSKCEITLPNNPNVAASFYVTGDLCLENNSQIIGSGGPDPTDVIVHGWVVNRSPQAWVGTLTNPTNTATRIGGQCWHRNRSPKWPADQPPGPPIGCWFSEHFVPDATDDPPFIDAPTADFPAWYEVASPGPNNPCDPALSSGALPQFDLNDGVRNGNAPTLNLLTQPAFHCETDRGIFAWDPATRELKVEGTVYYDGTIDLFASVTPVDITYDTVGSLYTTGSVRLHQVRLCADWSGTTCDASWNGIGPMLLLAADGREQTWSGCPDCGILLETSSAFQGAMYTTNNIGLQNLSLVQGPMVAEAEVIANQFTFYPIPQFTRVPFGTPATPIVNWEIRPPTNYKG